MFQSIHHIAIIASDIEISKHFYSQVLGFEIIAETYREARDSWKIDLALNGDYLIELFSFPNAPRRLDGPEARGLRHLAFTVGNIEAVVAELEGRGVEVEAVRIDELTGALYTFFKDPDGLPIELVEN